MAPHRLFLKKTFEQVRLEGTNHNLKRVLGASHLTMIGIGCIIGAGIYVMTGTVAANFAGPAVMLSFVLAAVACCFSALCYAELASAMPVAGSAYTYSYATVGEIFAWITGWLLALEYGTAAAMVATGWSGYLVSFLHDFGVALPAALSSPMVQFVTLPGGGAEFAATNNINLVAAGGLVVVTALLVAGVSESARVNAAIVFIKVGVLLAVIALGAAYVDAHNWHPFLPANEGGFNYGIPGVVRGASIAFFAFVGFEAVSTAASESRNPQRDIPIGILGSLIICTLIYMAVAAVLTGVVPYRELGVPDPLAVAVDRMGVRWLALAVKFGAVTGLFSAMLIVTYAQTRVFFAMARDGLIPKVFSVLHTKFRTPWIGTLILGTIVTIAAAFLPISILGDLVSLGTATAFCIVCFSVLHLRKKSPELARPFRAPGGSWTPILGIIFAALMVAPLLADIVIKASHGDRIPAYIIGTYVLLGAGLYVFYGYRHSRLGTGKAPVFGDDALAPPGVTDL